ncbi:MAG: rhomboid family intramembrane serine protease [Bacteroidota bacterium]
MSYYKAGGFGNYYRPSFFGGGFRFFPPVIKWLLISNVAIWLCVDVLLGMFSLDGLRVGGSGGFLSYYFALWPFGENFWPWQLATYMFMHGGLGHLFFNMLALWMFGMELENNWGSKRFLTYYLVCGVGAGITNLLITSLLGQAAPTVGASGAVFGVLIAFGLLFPDRPIYLYFLFPVKAKYFIAVYIGLELFYGVTGTSDGIAHFAHLGGAAVGAIYTLAIMGVIPVASWWAQWHGGNAPSLGGGQRFHRPTDDVLDAKYYDIKSGRPLDDEMEVSQETVDAILDKISSSGYQSLTEKEKSILNEASKKIH